jgi:hypothetical protein
MVKFGETVEIKACNHLLRGVLTKGDSEEYPYRVEFFPNPYGYVAININKNRLSRIKRIRKVLKTE